MDKDQMLKTIVTTLDDKKAQDIEVLKLKDNIMGDYFVIATGSSTTQVKALADEIDFKLSQVGVEPHHREGVDSSLWILLDYGDIIVHIFHKESRAFYQLERLWTDTDKIDVKELLK